MTSSIGSMMSDLLWIAGISVFSLVWVMDTSPFPVPMIERVCVSLRTIVLDRVSSYGTNAVSTAM